MSDVRISFSPRTELRNVPVIIGCCVSRQGNLNDQHMHDHTEIWYALSGTTRHVVAGTEYTQTPGSCVVVPPYTSHGFDTMESDESPILFCADFRDEAITALGLDYFSYYSKCARYNGRALPIFRTFDGDNKNCADILTRAMISEYEAKASDSLSKILSQLIIFLDILSSDAPLAQKPGKIEEISKRITDAARYIADNFAKNITLDELCNTACMSRSRFTNSFRLVCGMTAWDMIYALRLQRARILLTFSDKSIDLIAKEIGMYDKAHLSRTFTKYYGISPSEFRKSESLSIRKSHFDTLGKVARRNEIIRYYKKTSL